MKSEPTVILIAEDDDGHARLIEKNLRRGGVQSQMVRFRDGQEALDFLFSKGEHPARADHASYLLLLNIRIPKVDGVEVLRRIKQDQRLRKLPVIMLTTMDDPCEVETCHRLGCSHYIVKPVEYDKFVAVLVQLGLFLKIVQVPRLSSAP